MNKELKDSSKKMRLKYSKYIMLEVLIVFVIIAMLFVFVRFF
jgi:flagellar basal body-associated protein FliL